MTGMTMAKATKEDFKTMWKVYKIMQNYGYQFHPDDHDLNAVRMKNILMGRLDQLGTGGFTRVVMGCEMLIDKVCDPVEDHLALKPVYGAAPEMLEALQKLTAKLPSDDRTLGSYFAKDELLMARSAIANATGDAA